MAILSQPRKRSVVQTSAEEAKFLGRFVEFRPAGSSPDGELILLEHQDRAEGVGLVVKALSSHRFATEGPGFLTSKLPTLLVPGAPG